MSQSRAPSPFPGRLPFSLNPQYYLVQICISLRFNFINKITNMLAATVDSKETQPSTSSFKESSKPCRHFEYPEILLATNNFDESLVIGCGGFGKVYKGNIVNGSSTVVAAIKRLDSMSSQGAAEFWAEVETLSKLRHCHLVSLFGYCNYEKEMILIYEYMSNGTLADHLHKLGTPLSWLQRLKICIGAARGLDYLHTGTGIDVGVTHRDVKSSNILLHESWAVKISDFGLSKIGPTNQPSTYVNTLVKGTFGYLDPDYSFTGRLTRKSDVYALGVVLLEVLCRKPALDRSLDEEQQNLARWAQKSVKEGNLKSIIDSDIRGEISPKCLKKFVLVVEICLHSNPKQRPTMAEVVVTLESVLTLQEKTNRSLQPAGKTIFGRMLNMFIFPSNRDNPDICLHNNVKQCPNKAEVVVNLDSILTLQQRVNSSLQHVCTTISSSMGDEFLVPSDTDNSNTESSNTDNSGVQMGTNNHVTEAVESKNYVSPQENKNNGFKPRSQFMDEWIEQYEPGVYITLMILHDGTRDIKRVRFSRRRFGESQAEIWWSENVEQVYKKYNVHRLNKL